MAMRNAARRCFRARLHCLHGVNGVGGKKAPDLARNRDRGFSPYDMAALMWNHAPAMWGAMARQGVTPPVLDEQQAADLFVFFYAASYFETPGDRRRGRHLFLARRCGQCHGIDSPSAPASGRSPNGNHSRTRSLSPNGCGTIPTTWPARSISQDSLTHCFPHRIWPISSSGCEARVMKSGPPDSRRHRRRPVRRC